ncbi:unnamed protein product, partial [Polarella glacialis]
AMLVLGGPQLSEVRIEALTALERGLPAEEGAALPAFIAAGGLFVLLSLLSPSTKLDANPEVLEGAAHLLERLALEHGQVLVPLLQDCHPSILLHKLVLDSRGSSCLKQHALAARRAL